MGGARERGAAARRRETSAGRRATQAISWNSKREATDVLRRILETTGWVDRPAVEVQAEGYGVSWRSVRHEIDRLIRAGRIRTRTRPGGFERIAWVPASQAEGP